MIVVTREDNKAVVRPAGEAGVIVPPPAVSVNVTPTPATGFPWLSVTRTDGAVTEVPTGAEAGGVLAAVMFAAAPAVTLKAELVAGVSPVAVADRV